LNVITIRNNLFSSATYVVTLNNSDSDLFIIDCGDIFPLLPYLELRKNVIVLLTHSHFDHIYGLNALLQKKTDVRIITNNIGKESLYSAKRNLSKYYGDSFEYMGNNVFCIEQEEIIDYLSTLGVKVLFTPGHNPSCLTYKIGRYLFTGDSYIPGLKTVSNLPFGSKTLANESLEKILNLVNEEKLQVMPGHIID
jgi:glyoxylase-like metal-dependent hydrolase (beta-lactamase superfamily II)